MFEPFRNEPYSDFSLSEDAAAYREALACGAFPSGRPSPVGNQRRAGRHRRPHRKRQSMSSSGDRRHHRLGDPRNALPPSKPPGRPSTPWSRLPAEARGVRSPVSPQSSDATSSTSAWETFEAAKNWSEAEADVAEAIDFCEYYARQAMTMAEPLPGVPYPGEDNRSHLVPIGTGVVIPPWNFPLAILAGMAVGPVAAGNTVVIKPASATPVIGAVFMEAVEEAGIPPGVINFVPGPGGEIGDTLVDHPTTRFVNFTGSREVGVRIAGRAAAVHPGQRWLKRASWRWVARTPRSSTRQPTSAASAAAVAGAFGFQGQKCSACSRLILVDDIHDDVLDRVVELTAELEGLPGRGQHPGERGDHRRPAPLCSRRDREGRGEADLVQGGESIGGWRLLHPTDRLRRGRPRCPAGSARDLRPGALRHPGGDFDHAIDIANGTEYGLTGGVFSATGRDWSGRGREFRVGNLYLNRKITGALVGVQPFGGFDMSGSNAKAGGPDYLVCSLR